MAASFVLAPQGLLDAPRESRDNRRVVHADVRFGSSWEGIDMNLRLARSRRRGAETCRPVGMRGRATVALVVGAVVALLLGVGQPVGGRGGRTRG